MDLDSLFSEYFDVLTVIIFKSVKTKSLIFFYFLKLVDR